MATKTIYPTWGECSDTKSAWDYDTPMSDLIEALGCALFTTATVAPEPTERLSVFDIKSIEREYVTYNSGYYGDGPPPGSWAAGDPCGSELDMIVLAELENGLWLGIEAWNDYTGWGCQDGATASVGTRDDVIRHGLSDDACRKLGLPTVAETEA